MMNEELRLRNAQRQRQRGETETAPSLSLSLSILASEFWFLDSLLLRQSSLLSPLLLVYDSAGFLQGRLCVAARRRATTRVAPTKRCGYGRYV